MKKLYLIYTRIIACRYPGWPPSISLLFLFFLLPIFFKPLVKIVQPSLVSLGSFLNIVGILINFSFLLLFLSKLFLPLLFSFFARFFIFCSLPTLIKFNYSLFISEATLEACKVTCHISSDSLNSSYFNSMMEKERG